jgi:hypothetical protein
MERETERLRSRNAQQPNCNPLEKRTRGGRPRSCRLSGNGLTERFEVSRHELG